MNFKNFYCGLIFQIILVGSVIAQCNVTDLQLTPGDCNNDGNYNLTINFNYQNAENDFFDVFYNDENIGFFALADLPITIPNFQDNGEFSPFITVCINDTPNCCAENEFIAPDCGGGDCNISEVVATPVCDGEEIFYVELNFNFENIGNDGFMVAGNGQNYGSFAYEGVPIVLGPFASGTGLEYEFVVIDNQLNNCQSFVELGQVFCNNDCQITNTFIEFLDCNGDGNFFIQVGVEVENPVSSTFNITGNGENYGNFPYGESFYQIGPFQGNGSNYELIFTDEDNGNCQTVAVFEGLFCGNDDCAITDFMLSPTDCNNDGNYNLTINFNYQNAENDFFDVFYNDENIGFFALADLPITIPNFQDNGEFSPFITVCINDTPNCCAENEFIAPDCGGGDCNISEVVATPVCDGEEIFYVELNFNFENTGNDGFMVAGNGQNYGSFAYEDVPIVLGPFASGTGLEYEFVVIDNQLNDCQSFVELGQVFCNNDCQITNTFIEFLDCNGDGNFFIQVGVEVENPVSSTFNITGNGENYGNFPYGESFYQIGPFQGNGSNYELIFTDEDNGNCQTVAVFEGLFCDGGGDCVISDLTIEPTECDAEGSYNVFVNFSVENANNNSFDLFYDGELIGFYPINNLPVSFSVLQDVDIFSHQVSVCINDNPDCCMEAEFLSPCFEGCNITNLFTEPHECDNDGNFLVDFEFDLEGNGGGGFTIFGNGMNYGEFDYGETFYTIGPFVGDGVSVYEIIIQDLEDADCQNFIEFGAVDCTSSELVWPGDVNVDNISNNLDVLNLGIAFNTTGTERNIMGSEWTGLFAIPWTGFFENGVNYVHADANGNGIANVDDLEVVSVNYDSIHGPVNLIYDEVGTENDPELFVDLPEADLIMVGQPFTAPIILGTEDIPVDDIYGLAFTLVFDPSIIDPATIEINYANSWLDPSGINILTLHKKIVGTGELDMVLTKNDQNNVSGFGQIAAFIGIIDNIAGKTDIEIEIKDVRAINNLEQMIPLQRPVEIVEITVSTKEKERINPIRIFPNPTTNELTITNALQLPLTAVEIRNAQSQLITASTNISNKLEVSGLAAGVYLLKFTIGGRVYHERFVKK